MSNDIRKWMRIVENALLTEAPFNGLCYHGTTSKFVDSILRNGFKADPELKTYDTGNLASYKGTYFSDTFTVALFRGDAAVQKFGGRTCVFICELDHEVAADEDGIREFMEQLQDWIKHELGQFDEMKYIDNEEYREELHDYIAQAFDNEFNVEPTSDFYELFYHYCDNEFASLSPSLKRELENKVAHQTGFSRAPGNFEALNFRVPHDLENSHVVCVIECSYDRDSLDPSYLPGDFSYRVVHGAVPESIKDQLEY